MQKYRQLTGREDTVLSPTKHIRKPLDLNKTKNIEYKTLF